MSEITKVFAEIWNLIRKMIGILKMGSFKRVDDIVVARTCGCLGRIMLASRELAGMWGDDWWRGGNLWVCGGRNVVDARTSAYLGRVMQAWQEFVATLGA